MVPDKFEERAGTYSVISIRICPTKSGLPNVKVHIPSCLPFLKRARNYLRVGDFDYPGRDGVTEAPHTPSACKGCVQTVDVIGACNTDELK